MGQTSSSGHVGLDAPIEGRRSFLGALLALGTAAVGALLSVPLIRFVLHPLLRATTPTAWADISSVDDFATATLPAKKTILLEQRDGWRKVVSEKAVYVIKDAAGRLTVLSSVCPHLGCSIPWVADKNEFVCPCHVGRFAPDGRLLGGPPPRGMDLLESRIQNGVLQVHYQYFRQLVPYKEVIG
ncbi:MAG TPA: ubiquinol-cytochrome c reductase iron-sulfur subunit [Candidatus Acidoferrales bacterium]|nr:ubiquinol-cytochrome c reductase iron-sulfur subunit [Candidatus Acidoferrales bacterium]